MAHKPSPGSYPAKALGCTCPFHRYQILIAEDCPMHGERCREEGDDE